MNGEKRGKRWQSHILGEGVQDKMISKLDGKAVCCVFGSVLSLHTPEQMAALKR